MKWLKELRKASAVVPIEVGRGKETVGAKYAEGWLYGRKTTLLVVI